MVVEEVVRRVRPVYFFSPDLEPCRIILLALVCGNEASRARQVVDDPFRNISVSDQLLTPLNRSLVHFHLT